MSSTFRYDLTQARSLRLLSRFDDRVITRNRSANFLSDAHVFMDPSSYANMAARLLYDEVRFRLNQSPGYIGLRIDPDKFFKSISFSDGNQQQTVSTWKYAAPSRHSEAEEAELGEEVKIANTRWLTHAARTCSVVPWCFTKSEDVRRRTEEWHRMTSDVEMTGSRVGEDIIEYI
jgi:hypothetical protein